MATAFSASQVKSKLGWSNSFDRNAAYPLDIKQYFGSVADAEAAAKTAVEVGSSDSAYFYGMQLFVFDGTSTHTYLIQGDNTLKELAASDETVMYWVNSTERVNLQTLTEAEYIALGSHAEGTLYFTSDTCRLYRGDFEVTDIVTGTIPSVENAIPGKLYIDTATLEIKLTLDNDNWLVYSPGYLTDSYNWADADSGKLATIGLIKKGIQEAIDAIDFPEERALVFEEGRIHYENDAAGAELTGVAHDVQYDAANLIITIPNYGGDDVVINLPKDKFLTNAYYDGETGNLVFVVDGVTEPINVPASDFVRLYTASNDGNNVAITVDSEGHISASAVIDPAAENALQSGENGLFVDITGKMDNISGLSSADAGKLVIVDEMGRAVVCGTLTMTELEEALDGKATKVGDAVEGHLAKLTADGDLADAGVAVGGEALAENADAATLATEKAVRAAIDESIADAMAWEEI